MSLSRKATGLTWGEGSLYPDAAPTPTRFLANTSFWGRTGPVWVTGSSQVHISRRFRLWSLRRDPRGAPAWVRRRLQSHGEVCSVLQ